jgi:hypothetical protein
MGELRPRATSQNARKQHNDRLVRRLTTTATTFAVGLTGVFAGFSASAVSPHRAATPTAQLGPGADAALAKAIADYVSAATPRQAASPAHTRPRSRPVVVQAPRPAPARPRAVVVSGGS